MINYEDCAAVLGMTQTIHTRVDNSAMLKISFNEGERKKALELFGEQGLEVAIVLLKKNHL